MKTPNENGVYEPDTCEELAQCDRSYAAIKICQCDDGLFRYALDVTYSYGGFSGPISDHCDGYTDYKLAKDTGLKELLHRFPKAWESDPQSVRDELRHMKAQLEQHFRQPTLF
jgi:hypothetical protein